MRFASVFCFCVCLALPAGCKNGSGPTPVSAKLGAAGGQVQSADGRVVMVIPAGALGQETEIVIRELARPEYPAGMEHALHVYDLAPGGLQFLVPVDVRVLLDQRPRQADGSLEADVVVLASRRSDGTFEFLDDPGIEVDGDADTVHAVGKLSHFSALGVHPVDEQGLPERRLSVRVADVPDKLPPGVPFPPIEVGVKMEDELEGDFDVAYCDLTAEMDGVIITYSGPETQPLGDLDSGAVPPKRGVSRQYTGYACAQAGLGTYAGCVRFDGTLMVRLGNGDPVPVDKLYEAGFGKSVECEPDGDQGRRARQVLAAGGEEGMSRVPPGAFGLGRFLLGVVAEATWRAVDLTSGEAIIEFAIGQISFGAEVLTNAGLGQSQSRIAQTGNDVVSLLFVYGPSGILVIPYEFGEFGFTQADPFSGNTTDAVHYGGREDCLLYVENARNLIRFIEYETSTGRFTGGGSQGIDGSHAPGASGSFVSAFRRKKGGAVLCLTDGQPGELWRKADPSTSDLAQKIGEVGEDPRRVRYLCGVFVVSNFGSDSLTVGTWDDDGNVVIRGTVPVGDGPIGIDLKKLDDGNVAVISTGFNDSTYSITVLGPQAEVVSNTKKPAPAGCTKPGFAIWIPDDEDGSFAISCNESGGVWIVPTN